MTVGRIVSTKVVNVRPDVQPKMMRIAALTERFAGRLRYAQQSLPAIGFGVILSPFSYARSRLSPSD